MTLISARVSACDFVVKFSPSVCVAVVTREMAARSFAYHMLMKQQTVTNPTVIHGLCARQNIKFAMRACSGSSPDDKSSH